MKQQTKTKRLTLPGSSDTKCSTSTESICKFCRAQISSRALVCPACFTDLSTGRSYSLPTPKRPEPTQEASPPSSMHPFPAHPSPMPKTVRSEPTQDASPPSSTHPFSAHPNPTPKTVSKQLSRIRLCPACSGTVAKGIHKCPHCGLRQRVTFEEEAEDKPALVVFAVIGLIIIIWASIYFTVSGLSEPFRPQPSPTARHDDYNSTKAGRYVDGRTERVGDPRDRRWDSPDERSIIRTVARETGESEAAVRKAFSDEFDRRGLAY